MFADGLTKWPETATGRCFRRKDEKPEPVNTEPVFTAEDVEFLRDLKVCLD